MAGKITIAVLNEKIDQVLSNQASQGTEIKAIKKALWGDGETDPTKPSLYTRLDRLDRADANRRKIRWTVYTALIGLLFKEFLAFFGFGK